jgi:hypothetical protein
LAAIAGRLIANSISRDTATANDGALTQEFDAAKRADVQQGFAAAKALNVTGSNIIAPGTVSLAGESVAIQNANDTANSTALSKSSSAGVTIKAYENASGAVNAVSSLPKRIDQGGQGAVGTAITTASETLRTVAAVQAALTNTAGVSASVGFSKSTSTNATQETAVVGSTIAGGTVNVIARDTDITVKGSTITADIAATPIRIRKLSLCIYSPKLIRRTPGLIIYRFKFTNIVNNWRVHACSFHMLQPMPINH